MSASEILAELPRLSPEEIEAVYQLAEELLHSGGTSPELLAAVDEADRLAATDDVSGKEIRRLVTQWAYSK